MSNTRINKLGEYGPVIPYAAILLTSLGYFVDVYDILLFSIIRVKSLQSLGLSPEQITEQGIFLLNAQMVGLMLGGIFWGILGDKKGRLTVLFGSIFLYSIANIANGFVDNVAAYAFWRFTAGFGLAGELGAGVTLVAELMPRKFRGYATCLIAVVGISGAVVAYMTARYFDWRTSFFVGGSMGMLLLFLRLNVAESGLFTATKQTAARRGDFLSLFTRKKLFLRYMQCILIGLPLWFAVGVLISLSPEFGKVLGVRGTVDAGVAVACCYTGSVGGGIVSGLLSQFLESRKRAYYYFLGLSLISTFVYFAVREASLLEFYIICLFLGFASGYWALFVTYITEQFGINIRATVSTTVPNFVRGAVVPILLLLKLLTPLLGGSLIYSGMTIGCLCFVFAFAALIYLPDTFSKDLNYLEE